MEKTGVFQNDPGLLGSFRRGQREALERVYRSHVQFVERYLRAMAHARGLIELSQNTVVADLIQEVFVRAFSAGARRSYDGVRDYGGYLGAIARNCFIDLLRTRGREVPTAPEDLALDVIEDRDAEEYCDPRVAAVVAVYVAELPITLKGAYEQRFVMGRSQEEASAALGLSRRSLRTAEARIRRGLRKALFSAGISLRELRSGRQPVPPRFPAAAAARAAAGERRP